MAAFLFEQRFHAPARSFQPPGLAIANVRLPLTFPRKEKELKNGMEEKGEGVQERHRRKECPRMDQA